MKVSFLALICLLLGATARATIHPQDVQILSDPTSNTIVLRSLVPVGHLTSVTISNHDGVVIYTADLNSAEYLNRRIKTAGFQTGNYELILTDELGRLRRPFTVDRQGTVNTDAQLASTETFPVITVQNDRTMILALSNSEVRSVDVELFDPNGRKVLHDRVACEGRTRRAYQLGKLASGSYTVSVDAGSRTPTYTQAIALD